MLDTYHYFLTNSLERIVYYVYRQSIKCEKQVVNKMFLRFFELLSNKANHFSDLVTLDCYVKTR